MSPAAAGLAVLLHAAAALALWDVTPTTRDVPEEAIEVTIERATPEDPPKVEQPTPEPPKPEPPKSEAAKPAAPPAPPPPSAPPVQQATPPPPPASRGPAGPRAAPPRPKFGIPVPVPEPREPNKAPAPDERQEATAPPNPTPAPTPTVPPPSLDQMLPPVEMPQAPTVTHDAPKAASPATPPPPAPTPPAPAPAPAPSQRAHNPPPAPSLPHSPLTEPRPPAPNPQATASAPPPTSLQNPADGYRKLRAQEQYLWRISARMSQYRYYSKDQSEQGTVVVRVVIARDGRLVEASVARSSGSPNLDKGVLEAARTAAPYDPLPADIPGDVAAFTIPLTYSYRR